MTPTNEPLVIEEVLSDISELIKINKLYSECQYSPSGDECRKMHQERYAEIRSRINNQFLIHSEVVTPETNGQSEAWNDLQQYVLHYFNGPNITFFAIPSFTDFLKNKVN